ncbi:hypothetical protein D3C78_1791930 [compost metagenome]
MKRSYSSIGIWTEMVPLVASITAESRMSLEIPVIVDVMFVISFLPIRLVGAEMCRLVRRISGSGGGAGAA